MGKGEGKGMDKSKGKANSKIPHSITQHTAQQNITAYNTAHHYTQKTKHNTIT